MNISLERNLSTKVETQPNGDISVRNVMTDPKHHFEVNVVLESSHLIIKEIEVDIKKCPTPQCHEIKKSVKALIGVRVGPGLIKHIINALGGSDGCINVKNMLLCSLPLVINVDAASQASNPQEINAFIHEKLMGTCIGYSQPY